MALGTGVKGSGDNVRAVIGCYQWIVALSGRVLRRLSHPSAAGTPDDGDVPCHIMVVQSNLVTSTYEHTSKSGRVGPKSNI